MHIVFCKSFGLRTSFWKFIGGTNISIFRKAVLTVQRVVHAYCLPTHICSMYQHREFPSIYYLQYVRIFVLPLGISRNNYIIIVESKIAVLSLDFLMVFNSVKLPFFYIKFSANHRIYIILLNEKDAISLLKTLECHKYTDIFYHLSSLTFTERKSCTIQKIKQ